MTEANTVGNTSLTRSLTAQTFSIEPYKHVLAKFPNRLILLVDATSFEKVNDQAQIIQKICTGLYLSDPQGEIFTGDCPEVSTPAGLERILANALRKQSKQAWLIILHTVSPSEVFQTTIGSVDLLRE